MLGLETATLREILAILKRTYCGNDRRAVHAHLRSGARRPGCSSASRAATRRSPSRREGKIAILKKLIEAEGFERFLAKRFPGTKRFGLDGARVMVPALEQIIKRGGALGVNDIVIGMPHRGRLNVLAAVMAKPYRVIFHEFQGGSSLPSDIEGSGDVKYHLGASSDRDVRRQRGPPLADRQSQPPGDRQSGGAGQGAGQAGLHAARRTRPPAAATCCRC